MTWTNHRQTEGEEIEGLAQNEGDRKRKAKTGESVGRFLGGGEQVDTDGAEERVVTE